MIKVIATIGCNNCKEVQEKLQENNIKFSYRYISELDENKAKKYRKMAIEAKQLSYPIIIKDNKVVKLEDIL